MKSNIERVKVGLGIFCSVCILTMMFLVTNTNPEELTTNLKEVDRQVNVVFEKDMETDQILVEPFDMEKFENITIDKLTVKDYKVTFGNRDGIISYTFYLKNKSYKDAVLQEYKLPRPVCKGFLEDCEKVLLGLNYRITYEDGAPLQAGDILRAREMKMVILTLEYRTDEANLPSSTTDITNLDFNLNFLAK